MKRALHLLILGAATIAIFLFAGCASPDRIDSKPWNSPAGWEQHTFGVPY